jgi:hypothetical protein
MPHVTIEAEWDCDRLIQKAQTGVERFGRSVLKTDQSWRRRDGQAVLVEGVVVEFSRPLHPVAVIAPHEKGVIVRLWSLLAVERTVPVQRWMAGVADWAATALAGRVVATNLHPEAVAGYAWEELSGPGRLPDDG